MKLPIPDEMITALNSTAENMKNFGKKLDRVVELLAEIERNTRRPEYINSGPR